MSLGQSLLCRAPFACFCVAGCLFSLVCARADYLFRKNTTETSAAAVHLLPFNSLYIRHLAERQPAQRVDLLKRAVALDRFDSDSWMQLGFNAEIQQKNSALAERYFLNAAHVNRMYLPRWTLANFYFRRQDDSRLFEWTHQTLQVTPYDGTPAFLNLWLANPDPRRIAATVPDREPVMLEYAFFLARTNRFDLALSALDRAISLSPVHPPLSEFSRGPLDTHADFILDRMLQANRVQAAIQLWARLVAAHWIAPFSTPSPANLLTNGDFRVPFFGHGFDWRQASVPGVAMDQYPDLSMFRLTFSGTQPEACSLIQQLIPLEAGRRYRLTWTDDLDQIAPGSGVTWQIDTLSGNGAPIRLIGPDLTSERESAGTWDFQAPDSSKPFLLSIQYSRPLGRVRIEGSLSLRNVTLHPIS